MSPSDDCRSPDCNGVIAADSGRGMIDPSQGTCRLCGLRYRRKLLGWTIIDGPVAVTLRARDDPVRCDRVSFEPGVVLLTHSEDERPERIDPSEIRTIASVDP